jgi:hypothetical protein
MMQQTRVQTLKNSGIRPQNWLFPRLPVRTLKHTGRNGVPQDVQTSGGQLNRSGPAHLAVGCHYDFGQVAVESSKAPGIEKLTSSAGSLNAQCFSFGGAGQISPMAVQPKLKVGQPGDTYEQEADRIAEQIMCMPEPSLQRQPT